MKKFKEILVKLNDWKFIILIILIVGGAFYWLQIRPSIIKRNCFNFVTDSLRGESASNESYNFGYNFCLHKNGL